MPKPNPSSGAKIPLPKRLSNAKLTNIIHDNPRSQRTIYYLVQSSRATPSLELGTSQSTRWFCCCMLAITFSTEFTLSGAAAMAKHVVLPAVLCMRKLSCGNVTFMPENMNVIVGATIGTVQHVSNPPRDVTVRFAPTLRRNSSRTAMYAGATSRVNTVPSNV